MRPIYLLCMSARAKKRASAPAEVIALKPHRAGLFTVSAISCEERKARVRFASGEEVTARFSVALDEAVVRTAIARGEILIAEEDREGVILLGALRTAATPGVDRGEEFVVEAKRITIQGEHELHLRAGATQLVLRAVGLVETIARDITTRAAGVHKIVGRMIHLN
jgi:hypothetical protein